VDSLEIPETLSGDKSISVLGEPGINTRCIGIFVVTAEKLQEGMDVCDDSTKT
jgi:hypothetical protein